MTSILEGEIAAQVADAMADVFYDAVVTRMVPGTGPAHNPGPPTPEPHTCLGIVDDYAADEVDGTRILATDRKVIILATSLDITPQPGDFVTIRSTTGRVTRVTSDPALATWEMQVSFP